MLVSFVETLQLGPLPLAHFVCHFRPQTAVYVLSVQYVHLFHLYLHYVLHLAKLTKR